MSQLTIKNLNFGYPRKTDQRPILSNISISAESSEVIAIVGPSGCGKSTLLSILGTHITIPKGCYYFEGNDVSAYSTAELMEFRGSKTGFVFQGICLLPHLSVMENVLLPVEHLPRCNTTKKYANELLEILGVADLVHRMPDEISGGQAQRVAIARALIRRPSLLLADEPTGSLDAANTDGVMSILRDIATQGTTVIAVTHNDAVASRADKIISLK